MNEDTSFDTTKRQTINPLMDEINRQTEPLLKDAMKEFNFQLPLTFRLYNQIRFYEQFGKLHLGISVASKETLAEQFGVTPKQIERAYNNLTTKYKLGKWIEHSEPVFRNVRRTWVSNERYKRGFSTTTAEYLDTFNYYSVVPELLQRSSKTTTREYLAPEVRPLSESKKKVSESKNSTKVLLTASNKEFGDSQINEVFAYWEKVVGVAISSRHKQNRIAAHNLIRKHSVDGTHRLIDGVALAHQDRFAPRIADFCDLQTKLTQLLVWGRNQSNNGQRPKVAKIW